MTARWKPIISIIHALCLPPTLNASLGKGWVSRRVSNDARTWTESGGERAREGARRTGVRRGTARRERERARSQGALARHTSEVSGHWHRNDLDSAQDLDQVPRWQRAARKRPRGLGGQFEVVGMAAEEWGGQLGDSPASFASRFLGMAHMRLRCPEVSALVFRNTKRAQG